MIEKSKTFTLSGGKGLSLKDDFHYTASDIYLKSWREKVPYYWFNVLEESADKVTATVYGAKEEDPETLRRNRQDFIEWAGDSYWETRGKK